MTWLSTTIFARTGSLLKNAIGFWYFNVIILANLAQHMHYYLNSCSECTNKVTSPEYSSMFCVVCFAKTILKTKTEERKWNRNKLWTYCMTNESHGEVWEKQTLWYEIIIDTCKKLIIKYVRK